MPDQVLDVQVPPPQTGIGPGVSSHQVLRADLGVGGRTLVVLSGIACAEFNGSGSDVVLETCRVLLREPAESVEQSTAYVGLASISNNDSAWVFAANRASVETDPASQELVLVAPLAVATGDSFFHRFSYQVVLTERVVETLITGTLTWETAMLRPASEDPAAVSSVFAIVANTVTVSEGTLGTSEHLTPVANGAVTKLQVGDVTCSASYMITNLPKGKLLQVTVGQHGLQPASLSMVPTATGVDRTTLTVAQPVKVDVNFVAKKDDVG